MTLIMKSHCSSLTTTTGYRVMPSAPPVPSASTAAAAPKPKPSPPSAETLCLKTFRACWYLDKDWLVSFVASAQCARPNAPITWVEFMPKGHTHLVRSALKLVPVSKHLPLAKIKEVMFTFILETLNAPGSSPGFFNARKAAKPCKRNRKRKVGEKQPVDDMAIDALQPDPSPPPLVPGTLRVVPLRLAQEPETGRTRARFPPGPLRRHQGLEATTLSRLALHFSQTLLRPPRQTPKKQWRRTYGVSKPGQLSGCLEPLPVPPPLLPRLHRYSASVAPPLPPPHLHPRSVPPSTTHRRTGVCGWSGSVRPTRLAIRTVQFWPWSRRWTSARQL